MSDMPRIIRTVSLEFGVPVGDLFGRANNRTKRVKEARRAVVLLARAYPRWSFPSIARVMHPGISHTTAVRRWRDGMAQVVADDEFAAKVRRCMERIKKHQGAER